MSRENLLETKSIRVSTTQAVNGWLGDLVRTGLYGKTVPEAAERLITSSIQRLITEGVLEKRPSETEPGK